MAKFEKLCELELAKRVYDEKSMKSNRLRRAGLQADPRLIALIKKAKKQGHDG